MAYEIRPWREGDDLALLQIWGDAANTNEQQQRAAFGPDMNAPYFSRTLVATDNDVPVAAAVITSSALHPSRLWSYVEVAKDHRRQGLGTELLARLERTAEEFGQITALRVKLAPFSSGEQFAQAKGMQLIQRSRMVRIEAGAIPPVPLREDENGKPTQAIEDIATGSVELTAALWDFYQQAHQWDVPGQVGLGTVNRYFLSDEARAFGAVVLRDHIRQAAAEGKKGAIIAFAISYHPFESDEAARLVTEDTPTELLLGYDFENPGAVEAIMQLLSLLTVKHPVLVEVDDDMTALVEVTDVLLRNGTASVEDDPTLIYATR
ncbi:MAG: GNAT family N-acetyltransferase [Rothia sp. (in: high G+C Gram-positive bacteria)]|uniref:GNAT family N-acetyltransferase n=1 Tax=Rothia sp. (in: high G+C Gram-positive bacteria) TaxID=1885016 RepID=UPI0026DEDE94|nr:GNAT family N-acetyltransferase [Rothia sp. (in: high G+C Gram-positive bacteria)]MDO5750360.1 GNAT family N-acetyltransferase [Rothia sp. (in: high G+C Gram-positive bacteria)]